MKFSLASIALLAIAVSAMPQGNYGDSGNNKCSPVTVTHHKTVTQYKTKTKHEKPDVKTKQITKTLVKTVTNYGQPVTETIYKTITKTNTVYPHPPTKKGKTHHVVVGGSNNGQPVLKYTPEYVYAQPGDHVVFDFLFRNHTVSESTFEKPCEKKMDGFESGFRPNLNNVPGTSKYQVTVKDTEPHWVYCAQGPHCSLGMVFAINPPKTGNTYDQFLLKAKATKPPATGAPAPGGPVQPSTSPTYGQPAPEKDAQHKPAPKQPNDTDNGHDNDNDKPADKPKQSPAPIHGQPAPKQPTDTHNGHGNDNDKPDDKPKQSPAPIHGQPAPKQPTDNGHGNGNDKPANKPKQSPAPIYEQPTPEKDAQDKQPANKPASGSGSYGYY